MENVHKAPKIGIIETLRGLAALSVCLFHFSKSNIQFVGSSNYYSQLVQFGWSGVEAFFVVSGFIIPYSLMHSGYSARKFFTFMAKRSIRIESPYIFTIALVLLLSFVSLWSPSFHGQLPDLNFSGLLLHLVYLPEHFGFLWILPIFWTLEAEFHYYIFSGLFFNWIWKRKFNFIVSMALCLSSSFIFSWKIFEFMPYFVLGMLVCAMRSNMINMVWMFGGLLIASLSLALNHSELVPIFVGLLTSLAIAFVDWSSSLTGFFGKISYSLYLIHIPVGGKILNFLGRYADTDWKVWSSLIIAFLITLFSAYMFYMIIERPFQNISKRFSYHS